MNTEVKTYARARAARAALAKIAEGAEIETYETEVGRFSARAIFSEVPHNTTVLDVIAAAGFEYVVPVPPAQELPVTGVPKGPSHYINEMSTHRGVVAEVWALCDANPTMRRKDLIDLARSRGIAYGTVRTQYQKWLVARRQAL